MKTLKQIEWIYRIYKSIDDIYKIELKLTQLGTPFDPKILKSFVLPKKEDETEILYAIYEMIEKHKTDAIQLQITTIDCDMSNLTVNLIKKKEGD